MSEPENPELRKLPSVGAIIERADVKPLVDTYGREVVTHSTRSVIDRVRTLVSNGAAAPDEASLIADIERLVGVICGRSLKPVVNATGVILHTNLGRAPLGMATATELADITAGYSNLEFDLARGERGDRNVHAREMLRFLTGAEDVLVVNNNAAGIVLTLNTLARDREAIISRGELIEIGGSFRIPEIMAASGAKMVEVGTTNRTRLDDYEAAVTDGTALLFKAHKSNYSIKGFSEEVSARDLADLAHRHGLPLMYDIGSGFLRKIVGLPLDDEPDVRGALADGADVVAFSCDKLLGGPQAGVLAGRGDFIRRMARAPLMRAFRVGKLTLAALSVVCRAYLTDETALASIPAFSMLTRSTEEVKRLAERLLEELRRLGVEARVVGSTGQCGGGSLPDRELPSMAVEIPPQKGIGSPERTFAERLYRRLLEAEPPVLGILRQGRLLLDVLAVFEEDISYVAEAVSNAVGGEASS